MKQYIYSRIAVTLALTMVLVMGCKKADEFFQLRDRAGIDAAIWDNEGAIQFLLNEAYDKIIPTFTSEYPASVNYEVHLASDENFFGGSNALARATFGLNGYLTSNQVLYVGNKYQGANIGDNRYFDVARCNNVIKYVPASTVMSADVKKKLVGQAYALRAMVYFGLAKVYGGMPLVLEPQNPDNLQLSGRASAREMFTQVVKDLDSAISNLNGVTWPASEWGKLTKEAAVSLKGKVLLYWASPQFNPVNDGVHAYDPSRWQTALQACKAAYDECLATGHSLMASYENIFRTEGGSANKEALIVRPYSAAVAKFGHAVETKIRPASEGGSPNDYYFATNKLVDTYTMNDGTPITLSATYDPVLFWRNRDPRFNTTIAYNGSTWPLSGKSDRKQWTYVNAIGETGNRAFYCKRYSSPTLSSSSVAYSNDFGGNGMDWIEMRFAEVILNYAEAANETDNLALAKDLVRQVRQRAGIVPGAGSNDYGLSIATNKEQMRDLIINERMVEFAFEGKRCDDLRRLRLMTKLTGTITGMNISVKSDALRAQLEVVTDATTGKRYRDQLDMNNKDTLLKYFNYPYSQIIVSGNGAFAVPEYGYFYPLSNQFIQSSALLKQTIGWGGDFDPLQ
jgi:hypothetical protein